VAKPTLHLHFYLPVSTKPPYNVDDFANYLRGSVDPTTPEQASVPPSDRFDTAGVVLDFQKKAVSGTADFKTSLKDTDSVVVYLGHSVLDFKNKRSLGLSPMGHDPAEIAPEQLMSLLKASSAKLVILATCASSTLGLKGLKAGPAVVVTNSGSNLTTWSGYWGEALKHFLHLLIGYEINDKIDKKAQPEVRHEPITNVGEILKNINREKRATIKEALDAANEAFKENKSVDRFELAFGNGSTVVFPKKK